MNHPAIDSESDEEMNQLGTEDESDEEEDPAGRDLTRLHAFNFLLRENIALKEELDNILKNTQPTDHENNANDACSANEIPAIFHALIELRSHLEIQRSATINSHDFKKAVVLTYNNLVKLMSSSNKTADDLLEIIFDYLCNDWSLTPLANLPNLPRGFSLTKVLLLDEFVIICVVEQLLKNQNFAKKFRESFVKSSVLSSIVHFPQCRMYAAICRTLKLLHQPLQLYYKLLLTEPKKGKALTCIASIASVFPESLKNPYATDGPIDLALKVVYHLILSKPDVMSPESWLPCSHVFTGICCLPSSNPFEARDIFSEIVRNLAQELVQEPSPEHFVTLKMMTNRIGRSSAIENILKPLLAKSDSNLWHPQQSSQLFQFFAGAN